MSDFPFKVGDRIRGASWDAADHPYVTVTAVGLHHFLGAPSWLTGFEWAYDKRQTVWVPYAEPPTRPEWLNEAWCNIYPELKAFSFHYDAQSADAAAGETRIGRISGTGEWVPCNGNQVLA